MLWLPTKIMATNPQTAKPSCQNWTRWSQQCLSIAALWPLPQKHVYHDNANFLDTVLLCHHPLSQVPPTWTMRQIAFTPFTVDNHGFQTKFNLLKWGISMHIKDEKKQLCWLRSVDLLDVSCETLARPKIFLWMKERKDTIKHDI